MVVSVPILPELNGLTTNTNSVTPGYMDSNEPGGADSPSCVEFCQAWRGYSKSIRGERLIFLTFTETTLLTSRTVKYHDAVKAYEPYNNSLSPLPEMRTERVTIVQQAMQRQLMCMSW